MNLADSFDNASNDSDVDSVIVPLDEDDREHIADLASARHGSYERGETTDEVWGDDDSAGKMVIGVAGELVVAGLYDRAEYDTSVSAQGDGGVDCEMDLDGETRTVDIKSSTYDRSGASLMVGKHHVEDRDIIPDAYLSCYVDDLSEVILRGWVTSDELLTEENEETAPGGDWINFDMDVDELKSVPEPDGDLLVEDVDYRVSRS
ncbi:hypothetical protein GRS48_14040 [Halorubrum sp. JWXQ-INN 858]|uniref:hypothetical protein n=1 Tax=Halorubrum sp. JWXQ-INN 858 TaxID=2690782 RepID=UPI00135C2392|nr:hypothetical protein [Halorubrum sp. JWXQ-INN 858]MWV65931.1 hypothetical protein [Halorubrum sp. JWXQ-INN 858]